MEYKCPKCGTSDHSQKVSVIYQGGTSSSSYHGSGPTLNYRDGKMEVGSAFMSGTVNSSSQLARKLAPPPGPTSPSTPGKVFLGPLIMLIFGFCTFSAFIGGYDNEDAGGLLIGLIGLAVGFGLILKGISEKNEKMVEYESQIPKWKEEMKDWNKLYYCHKDDIMYHPENGKYWYWD